MNNRTLILAIRGAAVLALALAAGGCASTSPRYDAQFGDSVRSTMASQVVDPAAVLNANPVIGLDGSAARAAHANYESSFRRPSTAEPSLTTGQGR